MNRTHVTATRRASTALAALALLLAACGSSDTDTAADDAGSAEGVTVAGAWARNSPAMASAGAAYLQITSATDDALVAASVDPSIAGTVEVHETTMVDADQMAEGEAMGEEGDMDHSDMGDEEMAEGEMAEGSAVMQMRQVERIALPAGETVALEPGGYHVMLLDLAAPLEIGDTFELTLDFETAPDQVVTVEVAEEAPASS